jgi:hypothetical protein
MSKKQLNVAGIQNELSQSVYFARPVPPSKPTRSPKMSLPEPKRPAKVKLTSEVRKSRTAEVPQLRSYELRKYDRLRRLDVRLTREQLRFLQDMEDDIRETMPEIERDNPEHRRITKSAVVRVFVEMFRQFDLKIDASRFYNEHDLMNALYEQLLDQLPKSRSSVVAK